MITIAELFPLWCTSIKWLEAFRPISFQEEMRLEKEYILIEQLNCDVVIGGYKCAPMKDIYRTIDGRLHCTTEAAIQLYRDGVLRRETWYKHGQLHRLRLPAYTYWDFYGRPRYEWWEDNKFIRDRYFSCVPHMSDT